MSLFCFSFFFVNSILSFQEKIPSLNTYFYDIVFWDDLLFPHVGYFPSVDVDVVAQSLASGTVDEEDRRNR